MEIVAGLSVMIEGGWGAAIDKDAEKCVAVRGADGGDATMWSAIAEPPVFSVM
jgi:hypothetical protein